MQVEHMPDRKASSCMAFCASMSEKYATLAAVGDMTDKIKHPEATERPRRKKVEVSLESCHKAAEMRLNGVTWPELDKELGHNRSAFVLAFRRYGLEIPKHVVRTQYYKDKLDAAGC